MRSKVGELNKYYQQQDRYVETWPDVMIRDRVSSSLALPLPTSRAHGEAIKRASTVTAKKSPSRLDAEIANVLGTDATEKVEIPIFIASVWLSDVPRNLLNQLSNPVFYYIHKFFKKSKFLTSNSFSVCIIPRDSVNFGILQHVYTTPFFFSPCVDLLPGFWWLRAHMTRMT